MQPVYLSSITVGQSPTSSGENILGDCLKKALCDRIVPLSNELMNPFRVNQVCECVISLWNRLEKVSKKYFDFTSSHYSAQLQYHQRSSSIQKLLRPLWHAGNCLLNLTRYIGAKSVSQFFIAAYPSIGLQIFDMLEQVWLARSHSRNNWKKARHIGQRGIISIYRVIFVQVSFQWCFRRFQLVCNCYHLIAFLFHRRRLLEAFLSLRPKLLPNTLENEISYRALKV